MVAYRERQNERLAPMILIIVILTVAIICAACWYLWNLKKILDLVYGQDEGLCNRQRRMAARYRGREANGSSPLVVTDRNGLVGQKPGLGSLKVGVATAAKVLEQVA